MKKFVWRGKVEVLACMEYINKAIDAGHNMKTIYNNLNDEGKLTITYNSFTKRLQSFGVKRRKTSSFKNIFEMEKIKEKENERQDILRKEREKYELSLNLKKNSKTKQENMFDLIKSQEDEVF